MRKKLLNLCVTALMSVACTAAWALSEVGGVYQIGTAADLEEFAQLVNEGGVYANAVLTADIDRGMDGTMIGTNVNEYQGFFDGAGHTIKINMYPEEENAALFRYTGYRSVIKDLKVTGTITTGSKFAAAIVARNKAIISGCYADITINSSMAGDVTHGGIVAVGYGGTTVENCLAKVTILGEASQNCGGVVGWAEKRVNIVNCLAITDGSTLDVSNGLSCNIARNAGNLKTIDVETYNADPYANRPAGASYNNYVTQQWGDNVATTVVAYDDLADGRICYQLNNDQSKINWVQTIGTDPFPVPAAFGNGQVFASAATDCDGKTENDVTYSNSGSDLAAKHQFDKYGVCTVCGCFNFGMFDFNDPTKFDKTDMSVLLATQDDFTKVEGWNRIANGFRLNMKLTNDVEFITEPGQQVFNSSDWIDGNFNGQGHAITINFTEMNGYAGLFPEMAGNIENLILHGSLETNGARVGSLCAEARMALVRNVYSDVDITSNVVGDNTSGGFFGWMGEKEKTVENCIYAGDFTLPGADATAHCARVGGFSGWTATQTFFKNCATLGNIIGAGDQTLDDDTENSQNIARNPGSVVCENVYVVHPIFGNAVSDHDKFTHYENEEGIASGELAFFLNGKENGLERFFQLIGTDPEPMPIKKDGALVYCVAANYSCDGTPIGSDVAYSNSSSGAGRIPDHDFQNGWCVNCGKFDENFVTPVDGWFEIKDGAELAWWSIYASAHTDACAKLTDDIDMDGHMDRFTPPSIFVGTFDGQGHTISNFVINNPGASNIGLIGAVGDGAVVKNVVLDETCSLYAANYAGVIGTTSGGGTIYVTNVGFEGEVGVGTRNAAGIVGVCSGGSMNMMITNCWVTGVITSGVESGAICGYSGSGSVVTNCWSTCQMPQTAIYSSDSFTRGSAKVVNCYEADIEGVDHNKQQHYNPTAADRLTITLPLEEVADGTLCYNLNGKQFREASWYQTIDEDEHPYPFDNHGIVVYGAEQYFSIVDDSDVAGVASTIKDYEGDAIEDVVATQTLIDEWQSSVNSLDDVETINDLADALEAIYTAKDAVEANAKIYQAYIDKCEEVKAFLVANTTFSGDLRTALETYLSEDKEPSEDNPLGTYLYIIDNHTATAEEIKAETERVDKWLADALAADYAPGSDISKMILNSDFSKQNEGWTGGFISGLGTTEGEDGTVYGTEAWQKTGDMYQTVEGLKPGYYLIGINAAFRPSNDRYSTNYAAGIYANGIFNYFPAAIEDPVEVDKAEDGVNCNLTGAGAHDFPIYDDYASVNEDNGAEVIGYVVQGETGMAIAAKAGRYQAYTLAKVGEDGKFTVGIKNPGTNYSSDWTGWGPLKVTYCGEEGEEVEKAFGSVLENMVARANTILKYNYDVQNGAKLPNFPATLKAELQAAVDSYASAQTVEAQETLVKKFSELFEAIYEGKQAYAKLFNAAEMAVNILEKGNLDLVEKDEETGEWFDTGDAVFDDDTAEAIYDLYDEIIDGFKDGTYSTDAALDVATLKDSPIADIIPQQDEDGYYLIGTTKQFVAYRAIASEIDNHAKGKLTADIDLAGIAMLPIGHNRGENAQHIFMSEFDGQGHTLANVFIDDARIPSGEYAEPATLFYELQNATVKNFKLTGEMYTTHQFSGPITRWMSGKSTIDNVEIAVAFHLGANLAGDTSSGGVIGRNGSANSLINNCLVRTHLIGDGAEDGIGPHWYVGGVAGWADASLQIKNTLILSEFTNVGAEGDNSRTTSRGSKATLTNVFVSQFFREAEGTLVTPEQLASGEIAWKLNGSTGDDPHWFQTIGVDETPYLFGNDVVYLYGGKYTNERPNIQLRAFAYGLKAEKMGTTKNVAVTYILNAEAESVKVKFYNGETLVYTAESDGLTAGEHKLTVTTDQLGTANPTALTYEVEVVGKGSLDVVKMGSYKVWGPYGMAVNNNPKSTNFGQVLLAESWIDVYNNNGFVGYHTADKVGALYAFDQNFQPINAEDGTPGFYGGLDIQGETPLTIVDGYTLDLTDLRFSEDGRLFVARSGAASNSSVWEIDPENLNKPWKPVFTGGELDEATGITYVGDEEQNRMAVSLALEGKGDDLKMYVLGGQRSTGTNNPTDFNCAVYNLGSANEWTAAPSGYVAALDGAYVGTPYQAGIYADGKGGLWFIQRVTASETTPSIKHFDAAGNEDYSNASTQYGGGRMTVTADGNYIAIPTGNGTIVLYETNYVPMENGRIFLNPKKTINVGETSIASLAFDYAGNLYVASGGTETFSRYTIPYEGNKVVVTPGNAIGTGIVGDTNNDGLVDGIDAQQVLNIMAIDGYRANADVTGDGKVDGNDYQQVLNIMSVQ